MPNTPGPSWAANSALGRWVAPATQWMNGLGPAALGLAAIMIVPLALSWTGRTWLGLLLLAGAALLWWTIAIIGRQAAGPSPWHILPIVLLLAMALGPVIARGPRGFFGTRPESEHNTPAQQALVADREAAMLAGEQLLVVLLFALPLRSAVWISRWSDSWFRLALLLGSAGLLFVTAIQLSQTSPGIASPLNEARLATRPPIPPLHVVATLCGLAAWAGCSMLAGWARWKTQRRRNIEGDQRSDVHNVFLFQAALAALVAAGSLAMLVVTCVANSGELVSHWPAGSVAESLRIGGLFGCGSGEYVFSMDSPGLLWLARWRGVAGLAMVAGASVLAVAGQVRAVARQSSGPARLAAGGAAVASWTIGLQWLLGPVSMTGSAAFLGLTLWALSLGPETVNPSRLHRGSLLATMAIAVGLFGLIGLTPTIHDPLWFQFGWSSHDAEVLHGIWGLYITLICCLGLAPFGRPAALIGGLVISAGLAFGAQFAKPLVGRPCEWEHGAVQALAALPIIVILFLTPYRWRGWRRGEAEPPTVIEMEESPGE